MPKKGGKPMTERERARLAVIPTLYELYTPHLSEQTVDMIAKQCNYDLDECIAQLGELVQPSAPPSAAATQTAAARSSASNASSASASAPSSSTTPASASSSSAAPAPAAPAAAPVKKGILFLSPRPSSELNRPQPASVWTKAAPAAAAKPAAWGGSAGSNSSASAAGASNAAGGNAKDLIAAASLAFRTDLSALASDSAEADPEAAYGSDSNDQEDMVRIRRATGCATGLSARNATSASDVVAQQQAQARAIAAYTYTGFESQPYFDLAPRLADAMPPLLEVRGSGAPAGPEPMLDSEAPSAQAQALAQYKRAHQQRSSTHSRSASAASTESKEDAEAAAGLSTASPAHPAHALHALYLQLNAVQDAAPAPSRASWSAFASSSAPIPASARPAPAGSTLPSQAEQEAMTPAQALAWQRKQHAAELSSRREFTGWMKQHEKDKRAVRAQGALDEEAAAEARERDAALAAVAAAEAESAAAAEAFAAEFAHLSLLPTDIPPMAALSRTESRRSQEHLTSAPGELVSFLEGLFGADIDAEVIRAVVESVLAQARAELKPQSAISQLSEASDGAAYADLASQCCSTLLAILEEDEQAQAAAVAAAEEEEAALASPSTAGGKQPRGGKANKKAAAAESASASASGLNSAPFVAQGLQMSDAEIAHRMSIDPSFDPNAAALQSPSSNALAAATLASTPSAPLQRNKKGHIVVDFRSAPNAWAAHTPAAAAVAPTLTSQWNLRALQNSFPLVDGDLIEQAFAANSFNFAATRAHLSSLFPGSRVDGPSSSPQPVDQPWARRNQHHSKVVSTSAADAARGIVTEELVAARNGGVSGAAGRGGAIAAAAGSDSSLSDEQLEEALGAVLDNRGSGVAGAASSSALGAGSDSSLRALASVHARRRAAYFGAAAAAFNRGAGGMASELASKGRAERAQLVRTQAAAVLATFAAQNTHQDCARCIDLHGLRVAEALRILAFVLARHRRSRLAGAKGAELQIVTGLGLHSVGGISKARLGPAVVEYLRSQGIAHSTASEGVVKVFFRN